MTTILVAVASRHGATDEIAQEIAEVLRREVPGAAVEVRDAAEPGDLAGCDAVLVGSAIYMGRWLPAARHLVERHRAQLSTVPVWLFSSGPVGDPPPPVDDLAEVTALGGTIGARGHRVFAGRLDPAELGWAERFVVRATRSPVGDFRDHDAIRSWTAEVATELAAIPGTTR
ncbi:MAG: flavodoxin domain-containing protein [Pseudonocardia sp.]|nr:flavodoxin domain-containing protein [Pseudonocardia sp.]